MPPVNIPCYQTNDPYLASFLMSEGAVLAGCTRLGPKRVEFRFVPNRELHDLLRLYWSGERLFVSPARLFDALRLLKRRSLTPAWQSSSPLPSHPRP